MKIRHSKHLLILCVAAFVLMPPSIAEATHINCGDTLTSSTVLDSNLVCAGNGLILGASNMTLDCNGYSLQGSGSGIGIGSFSTQNIEVKGCKVKGFFTGVSLSISNSTLSDNTVTSNGDGIILSSSSGNTITRNTITSNGNGISLTSSSDNTIFGNTASLNGMGIWVDSSAGNTLSNNTIRSSYYGIYLYTSSNNSLANNTVTSNTNYGIYLSASSNFNTLLSNTASGTLYGNGIWIYLNSNFNTLKSNTACSNKLPDVGVYFSSGNAGTTNTCGSTSGWNDSGVQGCTFYCGQMEPTILSLPVLKAFSGQLYTYDVAALDPQSHPLTYSLLFSPPTMVIDPITGLIEWLVDAAPLPFLSGNKAGIAPAKVNVSVRASDPFGFSSTQNFTITVGMGKKGPGR